MLAHVRHLSSSAIPADSEAPRLAFLWIPKNSLVSTTRVTPGQAVLLWDSQVCRARHFVSARQSARVEPRSRVLLMQSIYVGNLPFTASEDEIRELFEAHGQVESVRLMTDRDTGRPRGFGFVKMGHDEAHMAIRALNGQHFGGRDLKVNEAEERKPAGDRSPRAANSRW
jgi:hypothetical protein